VLPPGLYEAIFEEKSDGTSGADLVTGKWVMRCEARTLDDIAAMGGNDAEDDRRFAAAARLSEVNLSLYRAFVQPMVRAFANPTSAEWMQKMHPLRLSYEMFSDANPWMRVVAGLADKVRENRKPVAKDNPLLAMQEQASGQIVKSLDAWRDFSEKMAEQTFLKFFGQPGVQAALGIDPDAPRPACKATKNPLHQQLLGMRIAELKARMAMGGIREAVIRSLLYIGAPRASLDERGFEMARRIREANGELSLADFKTLVREQFYLLILDQREAVDAVADLLPADPEQRRAGLNLIRQVLGARKDLSPEEEKRFAEITQIFGMDEESRSAGRSRRESQQRTSASEADRGRRLAS